MLIKVIVISIVGLFILTFIKEYKKEFAIPLAIAIGIVLTGLCIVEIKNIYFSYKSEIDNLNINSKLIKDVVKICVISYISKFTVDLCNENGSKYISSKIEFGTKITIAIIVLPYIFNMYVNIIKLL